MVSQLAPLTAVQLQEAPVITVREPAPAVAENIEYGGASEYVQGVPWFWVTLKVWPAMVIEPLRCAPVFAATE
jgi:hypothetical protein